MPIRIDGTNSTANPGITGDDADTGFVFGTDEISILTGGSEKVKLNSTGNLGLGVSSPSYKLDLDNGQARINRGNSAGDILVLRGQNSEKAKFDTDGLKFNGDTAATNALDDYEEGTFTPSFRNVPAPTYTSQGGSYVKNGKIVLITLDIQYTGLSRTDASAMSITGLPFTAGTTASGTVAGGGFCPGGTLMNFTPASHGETAAVYGQIPGGTTALDILGLGNNDSFDYRDCAENGRIRMIGTYISE